MIVHSWLLVVMAVVIGVVVLDVFFIRCCRSKWKDLKVGDKVIISTVNGYSDSVVVKKKGDIVELEGYGRVGKVEFLFGNPDGTEYILK